MDIVDIQLYVYKKNLEKTNILKIIRDTKEFIRIFDKEHGNFFFNSIKTYKYIHKNGNINIKNVSHIKINKELKIFNKQHCSRYIDVLYSNHKNILLKYKSNLINLEISNKFNNKFIKLISSNMIYLIIKYQTRKYIMMIYKIFNHKILFRYIKRIINLIIFTVLNKFQLESWSRYYRFRKIEEQEFLKLIFKDKNPLNNILRKKHFNLITDNDNLKTIEDIINFYSNKNNMLSVLKLIKQPTQISLNKIPRHLDRGFWGNGNSYFFNCLLAGFRKEIKNYELINENDLKNEVIFSINYYRNKKLMNDTEIEKFLYKNPITVNNGSLSSGRHRVSAMIGRLINGEKYIPFYKDTFQN